MIRNYLLVAVRNLARQKMYVLINIFGLGAAVAAAILGYVNYDFSQSYDRQHVNIDSIYRIEGTLTSNNVEYRYGRIPMGLAPTATEEIPGISDFSRMSALRFTVRFEETVFSEVIHFADYSYFEIFSFPAVKGNLSSFNSLNTGVITKEYALKYFGELDPIGREITLVKRNGEKFFMTVVAVTEDVPKNSSMPYNIILPYKQYQVFTETDDSMWKEWADVAFLLFEEQTDVKQIEKALQTYLPRQNEANPDSEMGAFQLDNLEDVALSGQQIRGNILMPGMPDSAIIGPAIGGLMILLVACFNFLHTAISAATNRMKEIGIRKTLGGVRSQLIAQFLTENILLCVASLVIGFTMSFWVVSFYDSLWPEWKFEINVANNMGLFGFLAAILVFLGISAGAYPAFYISKFHPVEVLKGNYRPHGKERLKKALFTGQFSLTVMTVLMTFMLMHNAEYQRNVDLGFSKENVIIIPVNGDKEYNLLRNEIAGHPSINQVAGTFHLAGRSWGSAKVDNAEFKADVRKLEIGDNYFNSAGLELVLGQPFAEIQNADDERRVLVTEKLVHEFGWTSPLSSTMKIDSVEYAVSGVMKDFYHNGLWQDVQPFVVMINKKRDYRYTVVRFSGVEESEINHFLESTWRGLFPDRPYDAFPQEELLYGSWMVNDSIRKTGIMNSFITVLISCMGLFALVSLAILKRRKEIGIRKVLGASDQSIAGLVSKEFIILLTISAIIGCVGGYYLIMALLKAIFAHVAGFSIFPVLISCTFLFVIAAITVSTQVLKAARTNPVETIRHE